MEEGKNKMLVDQRRQRAQESKSADMKQDMKLLMATWMAGRGVTTCKEGTFFCLLPCLEPREDVVLASS